MSQADNYTPQEVTGTTETLDVVLPWIFDGIDELVISQTDGTSVGTLANNDFDALVVGQTVTVQNFYGAGNLTNITVSRATKKTNEFTQAETNPLDSSALNAAINKIVRMIQDTAYKTDLLSNDVTGGDLSQLLLTAITSDDPFDIPTKENRENVYMGFDSNGNLILTVPTGVEPPDGPLDPESFLTVVTDIKVVTGTSYTLLDGDSGKFIIFTNVADVVVTTPNDLTLGHQNMYLKTGATNEVTHIVASGAEHVNLIPVVASKQYAWYSHAVFENVGGVAAKYRFIGEIDETDINNIEEVSRTLLIEDTFTPTQAQDLINSAGKFLNLGVELKILFEDDTLLVTKAINISGFSGPGTLSIGTLTVPQYDTTTARPVTITNTNNPLVTEYTDATVFDNNGIWDAFQDNSALFISGCTCSQIGIFGFSFNAKVFPVVIASTSSLVYFRGNFCNQVNAFTRAEYNAGTGLIIYGGNHYIAMNKFTTDTDTDGIGARGSQIQLEDSDGNGSYLLQGNTGVVVAEPTLISNDNFTPLIDKAQIFGLWTSGATTV